MVITWYGQSCFKLQSGNTTGVIDPFSKEIGLTPPRFRADFVLVTHNHPNHANSDSIPEQPFLITGPGEYETKGIHIIGIETYHDAQSGKERGMNTVYIVEMEDIKLCHLGDYGEGKMREELIEKIGNVDVLMIPVGGPSAQNKTGKHTIDAEEAANVIQRIEPRIVIPMHYKIRGMHAAIDPLDPFLKEMGIKSPDLQDRLTIKKKELPQEGLQVIILKTP